MSAPPLAIYRFFTKYERAPDDASKMREIDWVQYGPIGLDKFNTTEARVVDLIGRLQQSTGVNNPASIAANIKADYIRPRYEAWKQGREAPVDGTPLGAWNALTPEQADVLRTNGFKTVESISAMTDMHISRIPLPGMRELIRQAGLFIDAAEQTRFAHRLAEKDQEVSILKQDNADMAAQMKAMKAQMDEFTSMMAAKMDAEEDAPRRPGRPRKEQAAAA